MYRENPEHDLVFDFKDRSRSFFPYITHSGDQMDDANRRGQISHFIFFYSRKFHILWFVIRIHIGGEK